MNYTNFIDIDSESKKSFDESSDNANIFNDSLFEECFTKIFVDKKLVDEVSEEESKYCGNEKRKQNLVNFEFYKEKSNSLNSNENNSGKTTDKSKDLSKNCTIQIEKDDFCALSSIGHADDSKNNNSINKIINTNEGNICNIENNVNIIIKQKYTQESNIDNYISFLGRKRSLFKVIYPKDYAIFNCEDLNSFKTNN